MTVTVAQVRNALKASDTTAENDLIAVKLAAAVADVTKYLDDNEVASPADVPAEKFDEAVLAAACDGYRLAKAPNGVVNQQYDIGGGEVASTPVRISRDPLRSVRPMLELYIGPAIG